MGNVELFVLCETIPKVQFSECLLHWNQGIVDCTCGHLLRESESSQHCHQWRLDALSIPHEDIKKGRLRGARHGKTDAQRQHFLAHNARRKCLKKKFEGIHDRSQRETIYIEEKCIEMDKISTGRTLYCPLPEDFRQKSEELL